MPIRSWFYRTRRPVAALTAGALAFTLAACFGVAAPASADTREEQASDLKSEFRESSKVAADAYETAQRLMRQAQEASDEADRARNAVNAAAASERLAIEEAERARSAAATAEERLATTQADLSTAQRDLGEVARSLYIQGPMTTANAVLNADDLTAMTRELEMNRWAGRWQERRIAEFDRARIAQVAASTELSARRAAAEGKEADAQKLADKARRAQASASRASRDADRLSGRAATTLKQAKAAAAADQARYRAFQAETERLKDALRNGATRPTGPSSGSLVLPVPGGVSSPYGMRTHPVTGRYKLHTGVDLRAGCGTPVIAAANGRVLSAGFDTAYGNRIVVRHGQIKGKDVATTYNHQSRLGVRAGQVVNQGQVIGWVGTTGLSTGCHMHFEVLVNGSFVDPMTF